MWTKICGITNLHDAQSVRDAGAAAVGLNFYEKSKRYVTPVQARAIRDALGDDIDIVGVFVNCPADEVSEIVDQAGLTAAQFHGEESDALLRRFHRLKPNVAIIRAVRVRSDAGDAAVADLRRTSGVVPLSAVLVDAFVTGEYGGTGHRADENVVTAFLNMREIPRLILAGGLTADNVQDAVRHYHPWGVDTASGVESAPGKKNLLKVQRFVANSGGTRTRITNSD